MTLKPPTRTLPRLVMKDWPELSKKTLNAMREAISGEIYTAQPLSDFTRVGEGVQERTQKEGPPSNED